MKVTNSVSLILLLFFSFALAQGHDESSTCKDGDTPTVKLRNGVELPQLAFGTAVLSFQGEGKFNGFLPEHVFRSLRFALDAGMRHIDTALIYRSQRIIGQVLGNAFASGELLRDDIFITSKIFHGSVSGISTENTAIENLDELTPEEVTTIVSRHFEQSLEELNVGYLDVMLLHWPARMNSNDANNRSRRLAAWKVLEAFYNKGWVRAIGVSNFNERHLEQLIEDGIEIVPMINQIETSVYVRHDKIIEYCQKNGVVIEAFSPMGRGVMNIADDPIIKSIAEKHSRSPGQVALRYLIQQNIAVTFYSSSKNNIESNNEIFDFKLDSDDMLALSSLKRESSEGTWGLPSPYDMS